MSQAAPVAYKGTCFYSEDAAYKTFQHDWPQMSNGMTFSLLSSMLNLQTITYSLIDHNQIEYTDLYISLPSCDSSSFSAYALQDFIFPAMLTFSLLMGFGHGYKFLGSA